MIEKKKLAFLALSIVMMLSILTVAVFGQVPQRSDIYRYLSIFTEVFSLVRNNYVEEVAPEHLVEGAFSGVTDAVDEFSYYISPSQMADYRAFTSIARSGVGLVVTKRYGYAYVIAAIESSPAAEAGIQSGDFIEQIDGQPTAKMAVWQIESALEGKQGRPTSVVVLRGGMSKREEVSWVRKPFSPQAPTLDYYGAVAYIKIPYFSSGTAARFAERLAEVRTSGKQKLIVDLRGNAGDNIDEAIEAVDHLLARGVITTLTGRRVDAKRWEANPGTSYDGQVNVLVDTSTASGAEIFAAGILENKRGGVVGIGTYGKAIVQRFIVLPSGGGLNMTIGHYTTPDLRLIKERGVRPDVMVDLTASSVQEDPKKKEDVILKKALSLFGEPLPAAAAEKVAA
ncbi:MAG TPA: S41 family peptidase [Thermoanaerobaculia bacterium]|nr:S41 family peptidase [Thermoanaerobaculia bacterium]